MMTQFINPDGFMVVSADNIDFLHSYARVFKGNRGPLVLGGHKTVAMAQPVSAALSDCREGTTRGCGGPLVLSRKPLASNCSDNDGISTKIQVGKWRGNFLNCRKCKRGLVIWIGEYLLSNVGQHLQPTQALYVAGAFSGVLTNSAWYVLGSNEAQPDPSFSCNAEKTDTRLWLHARKSSYNRILILSPDTDIYHVGLPLKWVTQKEIMIQISAINSRQLKLLNLNGLIQALCNDPDQAHIDRALLPQVQQTLYVVSGCDYISFFSEICKATFFKYYYQYASFISSGTDPLTPGILLLTLL